MVRRNVSGHEGRKERLGESAGPALVADKTELDAFSDAYQIPKFVPATFEKGEVVRAVIGDFEPSFIFIDSFPSLASWSAMVEAEDGDDKEIKEIMAALEKVSTCSKNTLHRAEESE